MNSHTPSADSAATSMDTSTAPTSLLTDMYELTMLRGTLTSGATSRCSAFELFSRRLPGPRRFGMVAGTGWLLDVIEAFTFTPTQIDFLHRIGVINDETLDFLHDYRFPGTIRGYAEGECYFADSPLLTVEGTFAEACILETLALLIHNYDYTVAAAASRMAIATHGRPCVGLGAHRVHEQAAVAAAKASVVGGFAGTSNLGAELLYGIPTVGTLAHSFTLLHDIGEEALTAQVANLGPGATTLVGTYDIAAGMERAVETARVAGDKLGAVRLDSDDLTTEAFKVRAQLDALEATSTRITVTNDLDECAVAALGAAPMNSYGVGTKLVTGSGRPTATLVYRLVERKGADGTMEEVARFSSGDESAVGGRKQAGRILSSEGTAAEGLVVVSSSQDEGVSALSQTDAWLLQILLADEGRIVEEHRGEEALSATAERHRASRVELPYNA